MTKSTWHAGGLFGYLEEREDVVLKFLLFGRSKPWGDHGY